MPGTVNPCVVWLDYQRLSRRVAARAAASEKWLHLGVVDDASRNRSSHFFNDTLYHHHICDPIGSSMTYGTCISDIVVAVTCIVLWVTVVGCGMALMLCCGSKYRAGSRSSPSSLTSSTTWGRGLTPSHSAASASGLQTLSPRPKITRQRYQGPPIFGQDIRWALTVALFLIHMAEVSCLVLERRWACVQHSQFALPTLEAITAFILMGFYMVVERSNSPKCLMLATGYFLVNALCRAHEVAELLQMGYGFHHARIFLASSACLCLVVLVFLDFLLYAFKVNWPLLRRMRTGKAQRRGTLRGARSLIDLTEVKYLHPFSNLPSRLFFFWLIPFLGKGFSDPLEVEHLGKLPERERSKEQFLEFAGIYEWITSSKGAKSDGRISSKELWACYVKFSYPKWIVGGVLRLLTDMVGFVAPLSVHVILTYIATRNSMDPTSAASQQQRSQPLLQATNDSFLESQVSLTGDSSQLDSPVKQSIDHTSIGDFFSNGFVMMGVLFLGSVLQSLLSQASTHANNVTGIRLKLALLSLVYSKCLRRPIWEDTRRSNDTNKSPAATSGNITGEPASNRTSSTVSTSERLSFLVDAGGGCEADENTSEEDIAKVTRRITADDDEEDDIRNMPFHQATRESHSSVINLISEDVNNIMMFFWMGHYTWAIPLKVAIILCLLYTQLGLSSLLSAAISILVLTPIQMVLAKKISKVQKKVLCATDQRLRTLAEVLQNIKVVKMLQWEGIFKTRIETQREEELKQLWSDSLLWALVGVIPQTSSILVTLVTFGVYAQIEREPLTSAKIFTGLALFNQMLVPLFILPITVNVVVKGVVSTRRLADFFSRPSLPDRNHYHHSKLCAKSSQGGTSWSSLDPVGDYQLTGSKTKIEKKLSFSDENAVEADMEQSATMDKDTKYLLPSPAGGLRPSLRIPTGQPMLSSSPVTPRSPSRRTSLPPASAGMYYMRQSSTESRDRRSSTSVFVFPEEPTIEEEVEEEDEKDPQRMIEEEDEYSLADSSDEVSSNSSDASESKVTVLEMAQEAHVNTPIGPEISCDDFKYIDEEELEAADNSRASTAGAENDKSAGAVGGGRLTSGDASSANSAACVSPIRGHMRGVAIQPSVGCSQRQHGKDRPVVKIQLRHAEFSWCRSADRPSTANAPNKQPSLSNTSPVLHKISLTIPDSKLTMIVGDVGAGKSSLLLALLNELAPNDDAEKPGGVPDQNFPVAYMSQRPWLLNATIKDNILFGHKLNQKRYDHVLQATALQPDISMMPDGDATDIGDAGVTLSGGQRQRIALARALYSTAPLVLLDNPVASLDPQVAVKVFNRAIISYLSRQKRTVVMVTHRLQFLPQAGHVIALDKGRVVAEGSYQDMPELNPKLFNEWKRQINLEEEEVRRKELEAQAARERWKMLKAVTRFGLRRSTVNRSSRQSSLKSPASFQSSGSVVPLGFWLETAENASVVNPFGSSSHKLYLSRQVSHDCVLPSDEYEGDMSLHYIRPKGAFYTPQALLHQHQKLRAMLSANLALGGGSSGAPFGNGIRRSRYTTISGGSLTGGSLAQRRQQLLTSSLKKQSVSKTLSTPISPMTAPADSVDPSPSSTGAVAPPVGPTGAERLRLRPYSGPAHFPAVTGDFARTGSTRKGSDSADPRPPLGLPLPARWSMNRPMTPSQDISPVMGKSVLSRMFSTFSTRSGAGNRTPTSPVAALVPWSTTTGAGSSALDSSQMPAGKLAVSKRDSSMSWRSDVTGITLDPSEVFADEEELEGLLSEEERKRGRVSVSLYSRYLKACGVFGGVLYLVTACAAQAARVVTDIWLSAWAKVEDERAAGVFEANDDLGQGDIPFSRLHLHVYAALCLVSLALVLLTHLSGQYAAKRARMVLHRELLESVLRAPVSFFDKMPVGRILNRFSTDTGVIDKELAPGIQRLLYFLLLCLSSIIVNAVVVPWFVLAGIVILVVYYFLQHFFRASSRELQRLESQTRSPIYSLFAETLSGLTTIRAFKQEARFMGMALDRLDLNNAAFLLKESAHRWLGVALDCLGAFIVLVACAASMLASRNASDGDGAPAWVGLAINYTLLVPVYLAWVLKYAAEVEMHMAALEWLQMYTKIPGEDTRTIPDRPPLARSISASITSGRHTMDKFSHDGTDRGAPTASYRALPDNAGRESLAEVIVGISGPSRLLNWPSSGRIVMENVAVRYNPSLEPVLRNVSLRIEPGEKVGICGRTGSGKSTLLLSLLRMIDCVEGNIMVDGEDILGVPVELLRSRIATIPQDAVLFSGTIRDAEIVALLCPIHTNNNSSSRDPRSNLDPSGTMRDENIWEALESVRVDDIVNARPGGLDADVGAGGCSFSSGEIQLLCLGRASCREGACILLMDEASSALHPVAYERIQTALEDRFRNCTVLSVAHDFETLKRFDRIVVLDNGEIVEQGSPPELEKTVGGFFAGVATAFSPYTK